MELNSQGNLGTKILEFRTRSRIQVNSFYVNVKLPLLESLLNLDLLQLWMYQECMSMACEYEWYDVCLNVLCYAYLMHISELWVYVEWHVWLKFRKSLLLCWY